MPTTILVVDDSATMRALVRRALEADAYVVVEAAHAGAALATLATAAVDLVITDVLMPEVDGLALTRTLRDDSRFRTVPILILSTEATPAAKERGRAAGATGWLVKPFHPDTLRRVVRRALAEHG